MQHRILWLALAAALVAAPEANAEVAPSPRLFLDRHLIAHTENVGREVGRPRKVGRPLVGPGYGNFTPFSTVMRLAPGRWRLYYNVPGDPSPDPPARLAFLRSSDGIRWHTPAVLDLPGQTWGASVVRHKGAYRYLWWDHGLWLARSNDGVAWRNARMVRGDVNDIVSLARFRGRWVAMVKMVREGYEEGSRTMSAPGVRRIVSVTTSRDGGRWSRPRPVFVPRDGGAATEFYGVGGMLRRGGLLVGFLRVLRDDLGREGVGHTVLAWTRDGIHWRRDREPFIDRSPRPGWDHAMAWADAQLPVGRETRVYYGGYSSGHKTDRRTSRRLGLARMPLDRYVARTVGRRAGVLATRPVRPGRFLLNADVRGSLKVQAVRRGRVVGSCRVPRGNHVYRRVCRLPTGRFVLRFVMRRARLYGFQP